MRKMIATETKQSLLEQWKEVAKNNTDPSSFFQKVERDLKSWLEVEERMLSSVRARAVNRMEDRSTIMILDARLKELGEFRRAVFG